MSRKKRVEPTPVVSSGDVQYVGMCDVCGVETAMTLNSKYPDKMPKELNVPSCPSCAGRAVVLTKL